MHPIERLRYVARVGGTDPVDLVSEAAHALGSFAGDPAGVVPAARRLVARHPGVGPLWWMCSRVLVAADPAEEGWRTSMEIEGDDTAAILAAALPDEARVLIVGWPSTVVPGLARRGDVEVLAADDGTGVDVGRVLSRVDIEVLDVPTEGVGAAAAVADVVVLEADAVGPGAALCAPSSLAAAAVARRSGRSVWLVAAVGRVLPGALWGACLEAVVDDEEPWEADVDVVPLDLVDRIVGPDGPVTVSEGTATSCPVATELLKAARTPGSHQP